MTSDPGFPTPHSVGKKSLWNKAGLGLRAVRAALAVCLSTKAVNRSLFEGGFENVLGDFGGLDFFGVSIHRHLFFKLDLIIRHPMGAGELDRSMM